MPRTYGPPRLPGPSRGLVAAGRALPEAAIAELKNPGFEAAQARILIVRLSPWKDVDRSSSHLFLASEARAALPQAYLDLAFFPDRQERDFLEARRLPYFIGGASGRDPGDFDLLLVSNAFGLELVNLAYLFSTAGLPARASARAKARSQGRPMPLAILGGSNAAAAGPLFDRDDDSLVDGLFAGEGEGAVGRLCELLLGPPGSPEEGLEVAGREVPGFHPALHPGGFSTKPRILKKSPPPLGSPALLSSGEAGTTRLQITAGCPGLCSFCLEGWDRRPYREASLDELLAAARELKRNTGAESLELYSFNFNTHEEVGALVFELGRIFRRVNLMSQRLDILAQTPGLLQAELAADKRSFTLGLEGISEGLRAWYRKGLTRQDLEALMDRLVVKGIKELKLFYIIAGLETEADLKEFEGFVQRLSKRRAEAAPGLRILVSAGYLVRLPRTPLQYAPLALDKARLEGLSAAMEAACAGAGIEFRLAVHFDEYCADQLLSLGDGRLLPWLEACPAKGLVYEGSLSRGAWPSLEAAARASGLLDEAFLAEKPEAWQPPLGFLECDGPTLHREYREAAAHRDRQPCLGASCSGCGACPDGESIAFITGHRTTAPGPELTDRLTRLVAAKNAFKPYWVAVDLPESLAGGSEAYKAAWLSRSLMAAAPGAEQRLFGSTEALFGPGSAFGLPEGFVGKTVYGLYGPKREALAELALGLAKPPLNELGELIIPKNIIVIITIPRLWGRDLACLEEDSLGAMRAWCRESSVAATETRREGGRLFQAAARDLKKGLFREGLLEILPEEARLSLELGPKAKLQGLLGRLGEGGRLATVRVAELIYEPAS